MGLVADVGTGCAGVPGEQSRAGAPAAVMKRVLVSLWLGYGGGNEPAGDDKRSSAITKGHEEQR
jgi:hypothetical protein